MKHSVYGNTILPIIIAILAFLPSTTSATTVDSTIDPAQTVTPRLTLPWHDQSAFGSFLYHYPLVIPPGRNQLQPNLELTYNSADIKNSSIVGDGWSLTIPSIERLNINGLEDLYDSTTFTSSLAGELLPVSLTDPTHGTYGAEVETGPFSSYVYDSTETWTMTDANGTIYTFGDSSASRVDDPDDATRVFAWYITEIRDQNDNFISFTYTKDDNQVYPATITYTGSGSTEGIFVVTFSLEDRDDTATSYANGFAVTTDQRINGITIAANSVTRRTFALNYTAGVNGTRSLLQSITETGYDDDGNTNSLPSTSFTYAADTPSWSKDTGYTLVPSEDLYFSSNSRGLVYTSNYFVGDLDGNGFEDIFRFQQDYNWGVPGGSSRVHLSDGLKTWDDASSDITLPTPLTTDTDANSFKDAGTRFADVNGDGFIDIIYAANWSSSVSIDEQVVYINDGSGSWAEDTGYTLPSGFYFDPIGGGCSSNPQDPGTRIIDVNGDDLPDLLRYKEDESTNAVYLNNGDGTGWTEASFTLPVPIVGSSGGCPYKASTFTDVNNDQLVDILYLSGGGYYSNYTVVYMNTGNGWVEDTGYSIPRSTDLNLISGYIQIVDINGDGYTDLIDTSDVVYLNNGDGTGWTKDDSNSISFPLDNVVATEGVRLMDVNVDGLLDFVRAEFVNLAETGYNDVFYEDVYVSAGSMPNILTGIEDSFGASTSIDYEAAHAYVDDTGASANPDLAFAILTVASVTTSDGFGNTSSESYTYAEGDFYYATETDRQFAGFGKITKTDGVGNTTISFFHQGNDTNSSQGEATDTIAKLGNMYREETYDSTSNLYRVQLFNWQSADLGSGRTFVYLEDELELLYDGDADHTDTATTYSYDATTGNVSTQTDSGEVTGSDDGSYIDTGDDDRTTIYEYATDASGVIISQPTTITLTDADGVTVSETRYTYDGLTIGSVETGNVTQEESWISDTDYAATSYTYDAYGNVLTQTDPLGNTTTTTYDTANLYPATITDALSQTQTFEYDGAVGQPISVTEVNGAVTETDYDGLGRPTEERRSSDTNAATLVTTKIWSYWDDTSYYPDAPRSVYLREYLSDTMYKETLQYLDGLDRIIETKIFDDEGTGYNETETAYDALGLVSSTTLPEASADWSYDASTVSSDLAESYTYDALGRVTSVTNVLGTTTTDYDGFTKTVTDALGNQKDYVTDGLGRLSSVIEYVDGVAYPTNYTWDAADHLITTSDALDNIRNFTYDGRGLRLTAEDLHDSTDITFGTWAYTYDAAGNLVTALSPNNITVTSGYDELNRQTTEAADATTETDITYTYDSCTNGTGKLCAATTSDGTVTASSYTASGRLATETKTIATVDYTTSYTYDTLGNILTTTHPDGNTVTNTYNTMGLLATVTGGSAVVTDITYGPHGQITSQTNANGTTTTYTYDENERYRLTRKLTTGYETGDTTTTTTTTTETFYPTTGDGHVYKYNAAWDTAHDAAAGSGQSSTVSSLVNGTAQSTTSYYLYRTFLPFDTSALPDDATITSATLNVYVYSKKNNDNDGDDFVTVVPTTQASTTTLSTADFDQVGSIDNPTEGIDTTERKDITNVSTSAYLTFNLNSTGRDWISKTAVTQLGLREGHDVIDSAFTSASTTATQYNTLYMRSAEYTGTTYDPYLEVTYTQTSTTEAEPVVSTLQDLSYTYDATGNITQIVDTSDVDSAKTTDYTYDDLYRLTSATTSGAANDDNTTIAYAYDAIGNITSRSDIGTYSYNATDYANPHAVTSILLTDGTTTAYSYDNNGNLTSDGTKNYAWDYKNRLTSSGELTDTTSTTTTTTNFYPTTGDGYTHKSNASWDTAHDATSGNYATATATSTMVGTYKSTSSYSLVRAFLPFDTSSLPDDATITSATLKVYVYSKTNNDNDGDDWVTVVQGSQPSTSTLTTADYDLAGSVNSPTEGIDTTERKDLTSVTTNAYLSLALNSTGLGWISNTATTKLALREGHDVIDSAFTSDSTTATRYNRLYYRASEYTDTTYDPYLEVTYTQPSTVTTTNEVSYAYDHTNHRVSKSSEDATTYYPSDNYSIAAGTSTTSVSGSAGLTATIEYDGTTSTTETIHTDHLGSTNVVTDEDGVMIELLDYHPYGDKRISWSSFSESGEAESQKTFLGEYSDDETDLSYLNARYYDPERGQFLSQDPVFLAIGTDDQRAQTALLDPQLQNSYGYSRNNPMTWKDPDGSWLIALAAYIVAYAPVYAPMAITWTAAAATAITAPLFGGAIYAYGDGNAQLGDAFIEAEMSVLDTATQVFTGLNDLDQNGYLDSSGLVDWAEEGGGQLEVNTKVESTTTPSDFNIDEYLASPREFSFDGQPGYYSDQGNYVTNGNHSISTGNLLVEELSSDSTDISYEQPLPY